MSSTGFALGPRFFNWIQGGDPAQSQTCYSNTSKQKCSYN